MNTKYKFTNTNTPIKTQIPKYTNADKREDYFTRRNQLNSILARVLYRSLRTASRVKVMGAQQYDQKREEKILFKIQA